MVSEVFFTYADLRLDTVGVIQEVLVTETHQVESIFSPDVGLS